MTLGLGDKHNFKNTSMRQCFFISPGASDEVVKSYRTTWRFEPSPEAQAVVNAKFQAMETVDLLLNMEFNTRLEVSILHVVLVVVI